MSCNAVLKCKLFIKFILLFKREQDEPFAVLPFPQHYRIGNVYSMIVFKLNIEEFEYAYRVDGPYDPVTIDKRPHMPTSN